MPGPHSPADLKKFAAFGSSVGIEIGGKNLEVTAVRVRPNGIRVLGTTTIRDFEDRRAADWGVEYTGFLRQVDGAHLAATVLLPRHETIVRQIALSGVASRDLASAIALQIDTLHPYGEEEVAYGWSRLEHGGILIGILRRTTLDRYTALFAEAGIAVASFTFPAAAIYAAHRIPVAQPQTSAGGFVALAVRDNGSLEVYGESSARPVFSAEFDPPQDRAILLAISELRLEPGQEPVSLDRVLPAPQVNPIENDLAHRSMPYATALAGACPWLGTAVNLLPAEQRRSNSRVMYIPTVVLVVLLLLVSGVLLAHSSWEDGRYLAGLKAQIASVEPRARQAAVLDREILRAQNRARLLEEFRRRTKGNLDALKELSTLLPPPTWTSMIALAPDAATINGETDQAAPLLKLLDASPYFHNSTFIGSLAKAGGNEQFQIRTARRSPQ
jgi:Tfp pilus assembly protein PilN